MGLYSNSRSRVGYFIFSHQNTFVVQPEIGSVYPNYYKYFSTVHEKIFTAKHAKVAKLNRFSLRSLRA